MRQPIIIYLAIALAGIFPFRGTYAETPLAALSLSQLEQRRAEIDAELEQLAQYSLRSGVGAIGYRSMPNKTPEHTEWIEVELEKETLRMRAQPARRF